MITTKFAGKTWIYYVQAVIFGGLAAFGLILGPLFCLGVIRPANGRPGTDGGIPLCIVGVLFLLPFFLAVFNVLARRHPIIRICREGLEFSIIGGSALDYVPLIPSLIRAAWLMLSLSGFRRRIRRAAWDGFRECYVTGPPMARVLTIDTDSFLYDHGVSAESSTSLRQVSFPQVAFVAPLDRIADTIQAFAANPDACSYLVSWDDEYGG